MWAQRFDPVKGRVVGPPFVVEHYHTFAKSPSGIAGADFNMSVAGDTVYLNVLNTPGTIWAGKLMTESLFSFIP